MTAQRIALWVGLLLVLLAAWKLLHPIHTYRFKLTIEVEKNGLKSSGSSVIELRTRRNFFLLMLPEVPEWETSVRGEAVFVDLGDGDHVIALLDDRNGLHPTAALPSRVILGDKLASVGPPGVFDKLSTLHPQALRQAKGRSYRLTDEQMPPLVRFRHRDDPSSVKKVETADLGADPSRKLGSITARIEITRDAVTHAIRQHLPWLEPDRPDKSLGGGTGRIWNVGDKPFSKPSQMSYSNFLAE